ncbi:MAG: Mu transposase C-terminal domain-containing protein [Candidatus Cloacimonadaceae bacterium]|nr:Mu transposase C-terminal domain-containing protein [Candidatus Cloacimonadaceae bacterium]
MEKSDSVYDMIDMDNLEQNYQNAAALIKAGAKIEIPGVKLKLITPIHTDKKVKFKDASKPIPVKVKTTEVAKPEPEDEEIESFAIPYEVDSVSDDTRSVINLEPESKELLSFMPEAQYLSQFCELVLDRLDQYEAKLEAWNSIAEDYNNGRLVPELFKLRGKRTERSLRKWVDQYKDTSRDMFALLHKGKHQLRKRKVTYLEQHFLLKLLLTPQKVKIYSAVNTLKDYARLGALESPTSIPTLVRWANEWETNNKAIWTQARLGSKAVQETIVKTIHRDNSLLSVGDVWVADGHTLAFDIINPKTGKAQRMTMIMVLDWASRYPVGAALAFTEDSQHIQIAFRNAFLNYGGVPKFVYLDNGKAFRSKLFNEKWQEHDLTSDLAGIFPRLGIQVAFAESYNAKAKIIERFFKTFQERFERFISSFRGASIADKPATLMRNEKWAKKMYESVPPTIEEAMQMIGFFIRKMYGEHPHSGLEGKTPWQVYSSSPVLTEQKIEASRLNFLMMSAERKTLRNNGIKLNKLMYWDTALMEHIGKEVVIRYDLADLRWIVVYDMQDNYICQAEVRRSQDPFVYLDKDNPISHAELNKEQKANKRYQRNIANQTKFIVRRTQEVVDEMIKPLPIASIETNPTFIQPPTLEAPKPSPEQLMEELDKQVQKTLPNLLDKPKLIVPIDDDEEIKPKEKSYEEMLKFIGIM